jgi:hypothetical protein
MSLEGADHADAAPTRADAAPTGAGTATVQHPVAVPFPETLTVPAN